MSIASAIADVLETSSPPPRNESATCDWIITPLLRGAGYAVRDLEPHIRDTAGQYPDYTVMPDSPHAWYLEAKAWTVELEDRHAQQSLNYANQNGRRWVVLSNGRQWRLYDNDIRGTAREKHVVEVALSDGDRIERFLKAVSKDSVHREGLRQYAVACRLEASLAAELPSEGSELVRALWTVLKRRTGLEELARAEVSHYFGALFNRAQALTTPGAPATPVSSSEDVGQDPSLIPLDVLAANASDQVTNRQPSAVRLPDDAELPVNSWAGVAASLVTWLGEQGLLPPLPFSGQTGEGTRYFLNTSPHHPDRAMTRSKRFTISGTEVFLDVNRSGRDFVHRLRALCEAVGVTPSRVRLRIASASRPETAVLGVHQQSRVDIVLTASALKHGLLPTRGTYRTFFPGYKVPFILETELGETTACVTSNSTGRPVEVGDPVVGQYIQGSLQGWFRSHPELKAGDTVLVHAIDAPRRYRLTPAE